MRERDAAQPADPVPHAPASPTDAPPRLLLFGRPRLAQADGTIVPLAPERRHQLIAWLALKRTWAGRPELAALLWPEHETKLAFTNLRKALHRLHGTALETALQSEGQALRWGAGSDVADFEAALAAGRLDEAVALPQGELLEGYDAGTNEAWTAWLGFERERLRSAWHSAALTLLSQPGLDAASALTLSTRLLAADPLDESAVAAQMRALASAGQAGAARQAYRGYAERLHKELGLTPGVALKALHDGLSSSAERPAGPSASGPTSLSVGVAFSESVSPVDDGFIGRTSELQRIAELLGQADCAMLALLGPGGVGKTSLARRALHALAPGFADGGAFVSLEDVTQPAELGPRLAADLGLSLTGKAEPLVEVTRALRGKEMLLLLDNFETLAADAAWLDDLRRACPRIKVLLTSRVRPVSRGVWTMPIEGLPCPDAEDEDRLEAFDATRLFVRAAQRVEPGFVAAAETAAIADICRQVQGLPLALELAASFTRVLSCEAIAAELREGTELLRAADSARPARQASMQAVFEQSWRLLAPIEREVLMRLSVFRGGFAPASARSVAGASLPVLAALADKSLLRKDGARCQLHPLVQQFAAERLEKGGVREATERAHGEHFRLLVDRLRPALRQGQREGLAPIDADYENCRSAWRRAVKRGRSASLAAYAPALRDYCDHKGRHAEGLALIEEALAARRADADELVGPALESAAAHLQYRLDRLAEATTRAEKALAALSHRDDEDENAVLREIRRQCQKTLGVCALMKGRHAEAARHLQRVLEIAEADADNRTAAGMLDNLSLIEKAAGRFEEAQRMSTQALMQYRRMEDAAGAALCLNNLGALALVLREFDAAETRLREGLALCEHHGLGHTRLYLLANLADLALLRGNLDEAETRAERAQEAAASAGQRAIEGWMNHTLARIAVARGRLNDARFHLAAALRLVLETDHVNLLLEGLAVFAELLQAAGETRAAQRVLHVILEHPSTPAVMRQEVQTQLGSLPAFDGTPLPPGLAAAADIARRVVLEAPFGHAPLLAELRR